MTPSANAAARPGELSRMSRPTTTLRAPSAPTSRAMAAPIARTSVRVELLTHDTADVVGLDDRG